MAYCIWKTIKCEQCNGKGYVTDDYENCLRCGGYGGYRERFKEIVTLEPLLEGSDKKEKEIITVVYSLDYIKRICPYLNDAQAINVMAELKYAFDPYQGISAEIVRNTAQDLYFDEANAQHE